MKVSISGALALELRETASSDRTKVYNDLVVYEFAQKYRPQVKLLSVDADKISAARALIGRKVSLVAELREYSNGVRYIFEEGSVDSSVKAAA